MSRLVPKPAEDRITFFRVHETPWLDHAAEIGTSGAEVALLAEATAAARAALSAQMAAQQAAQAATRRLKLALEKMSTRGANIIKKIKAKAATDGDGVYTLASIASPSKPSPIAAPGQPTRFKFALDAVGNLSIKWSCRNPRGAVGTIYEIRRRVGPIGAGGEFKFIGTSGKKSFVDETLPLGVAAVEYQVTAIRSTKTGPVGRFFVMFGTGATGARPVFIPRAA